MFASTVTIPTIYMAKLIPKKASPRFLAKIIFAIIKALTTHAPIKTIAKPTVQSKSNHLRYKPVIIGWKTHTDKRLSHQTCLIFSP